MRQGTALSKVCLLIHPMGHVHDSPDHPYFRGHYEQYMGYCEATASAWRKAISSLNSDEALFIIPSRPASQPMRELEQFARAILGARCVVARDMGPGAGRAPEDSNPVFFENIGREIVAGAGLTAGFQTREAVTTCVNSHAYVQDLEAGLCAAGCVIDPATAKGEAWGQAFEGCVGKYAAMMGTYLNLKAPIAIDFKLCIPDACFAWLGSRFVERRLLRERYQLFLFERDDGRPFGLILDGFHTLRDEFRVARIPLDPNHVELVNKAGVVRRPSQEADARFRAGGRLQVPVGIGLHAENESLYIFPEPMTLSELRAALTGAEFANVA
ncbi:MAG: hypothetical protein V2A58_01555 [Planctomycetota bacterium]